jgi:hypothetical protein
MGQNSRLTSAAPGQIVVANQGVMRNKLNIQRTKRLKKKTTVTAQKCDISTRVI